MVVSDGLFAQNLHRLLKELTAQSETFGDTIEDYLLDLLNETALLNALSTLAERSESLAVGASSTSQTLIKVSALDASGRAACSQLRDLYRVLFEKEFNCKVIRTENISSAGEVRTGAHAQAATLVLEGPLAAVLAPLEAGTHLFVSNDQNYQPVVVTVGPAEGFVARDHFASLPPVVRIYADPEVSLDLRTQLLSIGKIGSAELRAFVLAALSLPHEFN